MTPENGIFLWKAFSRDERSLARIATTRQIRKGGTLHVDELIRNIFRALAMGSLAIGALIFSSSAGFAQAPGKAADKPYVIEYYYKAKWGFADEFIRLFRKNHYPVLKKQIEIGRILQVSGTAPRFHNTEDGRWDYRITIVFKNAQTAFEDFDSEPITKELYPDQETFKKEEQHRFEILLAHWDLPITSVDLERK